jgi:eukaryotic translation initiation factor 2C
MIHQHTDVWDVTVEYNITLKFPNMPLIEFFNQGKQMCVPAELLEVTEHQPCKDDKLDSGQTGKMIAFACKPPSDNAHMITGTGLSALGFAGGDGCLVSFLSTHQIYNDLTHVQKDFAMKVQAEMITVPARILKGPIVRYKASHRDPEPSWNLSNCRFMKSGAEAPKPGQKANWACYIIQDSGRKFDSVIPTLKLFSDVCNKSGLSLGQCSFPINQTDSIDYGRLGDPAEMAKARGIIESRLKVMASKVRIVLVILDLVRTEPQQQGKPKQTQLKAYGPLYAAVKYAGDVKCGVPTVCCQWDKLNNKMGQQQYMANVAMKFNFKLGGVNHQLSDQNLGLLKDGKAMLVSLTLSLKTVN